MTTAPTGDKSSFGASATEWLQLAAHPATVRRACVTAVIVGGVLIAINHGQAILAGAVTRGRLLQMCLTVIVPYVVSTASSVSTRRELAGTSNPARNDPASGITSR